MSFLLRVPNCGPGQADFKGRPTPRPAMGYKDCSDNLDTTMATPCARDQSPHDPRGERTRLSVAMAANVLMFVVGLVGWRLARSTALLADAFDMLADATGYAVAFWAVGGQLARQRVAAGWSSVLLIALGIGVLAEVVHRWFVPEQPEGWWIAGFAACPCSSTAPSS